MSKRRRNVLRWIKRGLLLAMAAAVTAAVVIAMLPKPVPMDIATATLGPLVVTVSEDGKTRVEHRYVVSAPLTGNMPRVGLRPGDPVAPGASLIRIAPAVPPLLDARTRAEAQARLQAALAGHRQATAQAARARAAHEHAESEASRQRPLGERGLVAVRVVERAEFEERASVEDLTAAEFGVKVAAQDVASARAAVGRLRKGSKASEPTLEISAPIAGSVLRVLRRDEGLVAAGTPLLEIGDISTLEVVVDVLTRDAVHIEPGAPVSIVRWGGDRALHGYVHRIEPSAFTRISALGVEEQRVNVIIDFDGPPNTYRALGDGFRVEVEIVVWQGENLLSVPASSLFRHGDGWAVFAIEDDTARLTPVEIGRRNANRVEIRSGLTSGTRLVLHPSDRVADGVAIVDRSGI